MDALSTPPSRRQPLRWYGALVALLLITGGLCLMFGQSQDIGWLEQLGWRLNYDTVSVALLWLGGLLMLPQLAYSLWVHRGPGRHGGRLQQVGFVIAALAAIAVLWIAPESVSIDKYQGGDSSAYGESGDNEMNRSSTFALCSLRHLPGVWMHRYFDPEHQQYAPDRTRRTVWRGEHGLLSGVQDTYEWHAVAPDYVSSAQGDTATSQPVGYECLVQTQRYFGPFVVSNRTFVSGSADFATFPECKPILRRQ